jgi:hypothetical protein
MKIQCEAMHGHPTGDTNADRSDLSLLRPDTGEPGLGPGFDPKVTEGANQCILEFSYIGKDLLGIPQADYRITNQLTRTMEGDVTATIDVMDFGIGTGDGGTVHQEVGCVSVSSDGEDRGVLQQQQIVIGSPPDDSSFVDGALKIPGLGEGNSAQPAGAK